MDEPVRILHLKVRGSPVKSEDADVLLLSAAQVSALWLSGVCETRLGASRLIPNLLEASRFAFLDW